MTKASEFTLHLEQVEGFHFRVRFDKPQHAMLDLDEPPPLGRDAAPNAARILAAAIGNCLSASLVFCMRRKGKELADVEADVKVEIVRNEQGRLRVGNVAVTLAPGLPLDDATLAECRPLFEDFCLVTESVRRGIPVSVVLAPPKDA